MQGARDDSDTLGGIVLPAGDVNLLLPNSAVAEIITYRRPDPVKSTFAWLLGIIDWRDNLVPVISLAADQGGKAREELGRRACFVVCYLPSGNPELPYVAVLASAAPRLVRFRAIDIKPASAALTNPFVLHSLSYDSQPALIPNMDAIERAVLAAQ